MMENTMTDGQNIIKGEVYVLGDNIDTDQIIPAEHLNLVPTIQEEYEKLGALALCGLPPEIQPRFVSEGETKTKYKIIVGGDNFGCGSSREHAPVCLGAAGAKAVVANAFARIFFRNCVATGEIYPIETETPLNTILNTGDEVEIDLDAMTLTVSATGEKHPLKEMGDVKGVIDSGGIFEHARKTGMI
jgi:3-isopropylmalate/(R)-2-methylmalate dehydratase small subunit